MNLLKCYEPLVLHSLSWQFQTSIFATPQSFRFPASPTTAMATTTPELDSDEWELVNDGLFVYKRKKRRLDPSAVARPADPAPDPELVARQRRQRKVATLLKVRDRYAKEISLWEHMANALRAMEESARDKHADDPDRAETLGQDRIYPSEREPGANSVIDELLMQVEGQEAIIEHFTKICDAAEAICESHEENVKQWLLDLPVWDSPIELLASLSED